MAGLALKAVGARLLGNGRHGGLWAADALALPPTDVWANALVLEGLVEATPLKGGRMGSALADAADGPEGWSLNGAQESGAMGMGT